MTAPERVGVHRPVMVDDVIECLAPAEGRTYVDGTFGRGGHVRAMLAAADCRVFAIDRDPAAIAAGKPLAQAHGGRLVLLAGRFADMDRLLAAHGVDRAAGVVLDLGVSSPQLDDPARGFSFAGDGPLDMRMERAGPTAADLVNRASEADLADIIFKLGEEHRARAVARAIVKARAKAPIERTGALAEIVAGAVARGRTGPRGRGIHPATRTFQALRIHLNDELGQLRQGLRAAERLLAPDGRLVVLAFHSLEDRTVKAFLRARAGDQPRPSRHLPLDAGAAPEPTFRLLFRRVRMPRATEIAENPRARSARLRAAVRTAAPARPNDGGMAAAA